jgi:DNA-binding protein YbaB
MKRLVLFMLLTAMVLLVFSCADLSTPKGTVEYFVEHIKRGNIDEATKVLTTPEFMDPIKENVQDPVEMVITRMQIEKGEFVFSNEAIDGDSATVDVHMKVLTPEGTAVLRDLLQRAHQDISEELTEEQLLEELKKQADEVEWSGLSSKEQTIRYSLVRSGDRWQIDAMATEEIETKE